MISRLPNRELGLLQQSVSRFRKLVNAPRKHHALFQRRTDFLFVCSAMDILDDTLLALHSYVRHDHNDQGLAYLEVFGVLQSLSVQQDAVCKLHKIVIGAPVDLVADFPEIGDVRDARVRIAGHPVGGRAASHFMIRYTVSKGGFEFWAYDQKGGRTVAHVDLFDLIARNSNALHRAVNRLIAHMENEDREHKLEFSDQHLADLFSASTYCSGKLFEALSQRNPIGKVGTRCIRSMLASFEESLAKRSAHFTETDFVRYNMPILKHALDRYDRYIDGGDDQSDHDAYILARYIQVELDDLVELAREIDADYGVVETQDRTGGEL